MRLMKVRFKLLFGIFLLSIVSINSCKKKEKCETCKLIDINTGYVSQTQIMCGDDAINHLKSRGWTCK